MCLPVNFIWTYNQIRTFRLGYKYAVKMYFDWKEEEEKKRQRRSPNMHMKEKTRGKKSNATININLDKWLLWALYVDKMETSVAAVATATAMEKRSVHSTENTIHTHFVYQPIYTAGWRRKNWGEAVLNLSSWLMCLVVWWVQITRLPVVSYDLWWWSSAQIRFLIHAIYMDDFFMFIASKMYIHLNINDYRCNVTAKWTCVYMDSIAFAHT